MDSHSYGGFNTSGSSFLQELTVEDPTKDAYPASQVTQQRSYQTYQEPTPGHYSTASDIPPNSYYSGQYDMESYYFNHPVYSHREKYTENSYAAPAMSSLPSSHSQVHQRPVSSQSSLTSGWTESQQPPQYQPDPYTSQTTFHSGGGSSSSRLPVTNYPPGHMPSISASSSQQPYQNSSATPYQVTSRPYCHGEMLPGTYSGLSLPSQPPPHSLSTNGEPMSPYTQQSRISRQQLQKSTKRLPRPRGGGPATRPLYSPHPMHEPAALERFVNTQCPPNVISVGSAADPLPRSLSLHSQSQQLALPSTISTSQICPPVEPSPHVSPLIEGRCHSVTKLKSMSAEIGEKEEGQIRLPSFSEPPVTQTLSPSPIRVKSPELTMSPLQSSSNTALPPAQLSPLVSQPVGAVVGSPQTAFSPRSEQIHESSPKPPSLKSPLPVQSPPASSINDNPPPILPKELLEVEELAEMNSKGSDNVEHLASNESMTLIKPELGDDKGLTKRLRGRRRKAEQFGDNHEMNSVISVSSAAVEKKRPSKTSESTGKRKAGALVSTNVKRSRRKTSSLKTTREGPLRLDAQGMEVGGANNPRVPDVRSTFFDGEDDEDTMAASVALTEVDEESITATTTTTEEPGEVFLKRPRPLPRLRVPRPKKKKSLKSLMKKKRRGAYHYGDESDVSESDDDGAGVSLRGNPHSNASHGIHSQIGEENSLDGSTRRSGRRAADRKKYTIDSVDFGLSDDGVGEGDSADGSDNEAINGSGRKHDADFVGVKVVEKILGRRMSTRPVKKSRKNKNVSPRKDQAHNFEEWKSCGLNEEIARTEYRDRNNQKYQEKTSVEELKNEEVEEEQVEEFYLKYKGFSYMHCDWKALDEIGDPRISTKLKKFLVKNGTDPIPPSNADDDDGTTMLFNPDYVEVDRVLDIRIYERVSGEIVTDDILNSDGTNKRSQGPLRGRKRRGRPPRSRTQEEDTEDEATATNANTPETAGSETQEETTNLDDEQPATVTYYLVKWRSLPYEDATWELAEDVDPVKVKEFMRIRNPPKNPPIIRDSNHKIIRPDPSVWRPITEDELYRNDNRLREYQVEGVNWLSFCWYNRRNCILADEMGLGKTVQSIAFLLEIVKAGVSGPFLIIVPLSTVGNWQREFENWSDLNAIVYHGSAVSRSMIQEYELFYHRKRITGGSSTTLSSTSNNGFSISQYRHDVYKFNALITTFEVLMSDIEFFGKMHWAVAIIDEAHRLKNKKCKLGEGLRYLDLDHRVLLTGTPLQNNVEELFGLLNFLEPERFSCATTFLAEYGELKTEQQVEDLKSLLKPMMLRRLKEDVEKSLAPKEETIIEVELTNLQKKYYRAIMERNFTFLCKGTTGSNMPNLMNVMMELRKCCNHPFLIKGAEETILAEQRVLAESDPSRPYNEEQQMFNALLNASGKLVLIHKLLPKLKAGGHKVLVFSQMIRVLDILEDYLVYQGFSFERIDGRIHGLMRQEAIDRFCNDPDKFVFLLCTKAGGLGINLTAADVVIIYDSDWNPQNDLQAQARCHRIGQQKMVKVYRLITRNTYEREMFDRASLKLGLDKAVLQSTGAHARQAQLSKKEVEELLKKGAYGALMDDDKAGDDFCEEDIDQILQSRSHVVQLEQGEKNSTFSKATFSISDNRNDIALDDPDFWQKWAKKAGVEEVGLEFEDLIMTTPRQRRQTHRYTAELNEQQSTSGLVHSQSSSRIHNGNNGGGSNAESSDGENSSGESSGADDDGGDSRASGATTGNATSSKTKHKKNRKCRRNEEGIGESIDRVDLFRVEKCLFTWSWGRWTHALDCFPFKRAISELEMQRIARCILGYALKVTPALTGGGDARVRAVVMEMINSTDVNSLRTIVDVAQSLKSSNNEASCRASGGIGPNVSGGVVARRGRRAGVRAGCFGTDSPNAPSTPTTPTTITFDVEPPSTVDTLKQEDQTQDVHKKEEDVDQGDFGITSDSFKRHLLRAGGRLLVRVYTLYFLHTEIVGLEHADGLCDGSLDHTVFTQLAETLPPLKALDADVPADWWDSCCDKCLLLGVFKHGWEKYFAIRDDPAFCFYRRIYGNSAPPIPIPSTTGTSRSVATVKIKSEMQGGSGQDTVTPKPEEEYEEKTLTIATDDTTPVTSRSRNGEVETDVEEGRIASNEDESQLPPPLLIFPAVVDLNSRMRKLIAYFQRVRTQVEIEAVHNLRSECIPTVAAQPYLEQRNIKWSRREEADFYRVVSSFGVEQVMRSPPHSPITTRRPGSGRVFAGYNWTNFKVLANLSKKSDQAITEYYNSFLTMCHRVCNDPLPEGTPPPVCSLPTTTTYGSCSADEVIPVAPISEERATRTLSRIKLLNRIRNNILTHEHLEERLALCQRSSDLPEWWVPGQHDRELLQAVARHGLARTDLNILPDKKFSFSRVSALVRRQLLKNPSALHGITPPTAATPAEAPVGNSLSVSEVEARASLAAAASIAARAVASELEAKIDSVNVLQTEDPSSSKTVRGESEHQENPTERPENGGSEDYPNVTVPIDESEPTSFISKSSNNEPFKWSLQFATSLAVAWPKDRTIHNRLEMVCQCIETGHWPLPRRYILNNAEELGRYHLAESTAGGSRDASPAPPSSPDISTQKKTLSSTEAATLAALSAAGYTNVDQVLAFQAAVSAGTAAGAGSHQPDAGAVTSSASVTISTRGGRGGGRGSRGGRGRGRGSRGGGGGGGGGAGVGTYSREDFASAASLASVAKNSGSPLPTRGRGSRGGQMPPPRGSPGSTRGRKRKFESAETKSSLPPPDSSAWEVNVPLISLVNGNLIHGEKAPKRRHLEAWLEANPDYMPYSVEPEDQVIFNRVAKARGQDTSAMEALAYRHYMSSVLSKVASYAASTSQRPTPPTPSASASELMEQQQKQLLAFVAASAYSGNPAYASLIASALGYSQAAAAVANTSTPSSHQKSGDPEKTATEVKTSSSTASDPTDLDDQTKRSGGIEASVTPSSASATMPNQLTPKNLQSMLTAYQQAASFVAAAYMYNPSLYGQHFGGGCSSSTSAPSTSGSIPSASSSTVTGTSSSDALQRQQMSALLSSVFGSAPIKSQSTIETAAELLDSSPPLQSSSRNEDEEERLPREHETTTGVCIGAGVGESALGTTGEGGGSVSAGDSDVLDLSKPE